jgi:hypothetical protein
MGLSALWSFRPDVDGNCMTGVAQSDFKGLAVHRTNAGPPLARAPIHASSSHAQRPKPVCIGRTLPCEVIGRSRVLLLGLFLLVCLPPVADEECSGCPDDARKKGRCIGVGLGPLSFELLKKQHVRDAEKKKRHDGERNARFALKRSNGRKWLSLRAYRARSTSAETPQVLGGKA